LLLDAHLEPRPWGGRGLARFGFELPVGERIGEAWITGASATIANGPHAGSPLGDLVAVDTTGTIGEPGLALTRGQPLFPLLIKLIDAEENLSIQVHPDDAHAPPGELGKTEAWHVLDARRESGLYLGLAAGVEAGEFAALARAGQPTAHLLRRVPAMPGQTYLLPAGTLHALGAGVTIYEIQQPSNITYRLDDWGRLDAQGRSRELHLDAGLAALDPTSRPESVAPASLPTPAGKRDRLVACRFFALERFELVAGETVRLDGEGTPQVVTCLAGRALIHSDGRHAELASGRSAALLASSGPAELTAVEAATLFRGRIGSDT
jgi:mannose-6-phosphate isomerase